MKTDHATLPMVNALLTSKQIPLLAEVQMSALLHYMFHAAPQPLRIKVAEIIYQHDYHHPKAFELFLACTLPLAQRIAERKAQKVFVYPSDWQIEVMYDGAVNAAIAIFQRHTTLGPLPDAFRRYLLAALSRNTLRAYFMRQENSYIRTVGDVASVVGPPPQFVRSTIDNDVITRELLEKVIAFPHLPDPVRATLQCILALGPDVALKEHAYAPYPVKKRAWGTPILNPDAIANALGIPRKKVHNHLRLARVILRDVFNVDGRLFLDR